MQILEKQNLDPDRPSAIVGIGSSAGGLKVLRTVLEHFKPGHGVSYVLIQHLDPTHKSSLPELAGKWCDLPVLTAENDMPVKPDHVYVIPSGVFPAIHNNCLQLAEAELTHGIRLPIDFFLRSLAADAGSRAIGVILSGAGSDGTLGMRAIKEHNGLGIAQDPATAQFDSMPGAAIDAELIDLILPPAAIAGAIYDYVEQRENRDNIVTEISDELAEQINQILAMVGAHTGRDFRGYKKSTVLRRIQRRMAVCKSQSLRTYYEFVQQQPDELNKLANDLLIGVTAFFRDTEAYRTLTLEVIPNLFNDKEPNAAVRVWVAGCSTGEEVYSIAILLFEFMLQNDNHHPIQIFATDLDEVALEVARTGLYPESIAVDVGSDKLVRFFTHSGQGYRINKDIRESIIFAHHDLISDPPFSRLDMVACRNVLIYLEPDTQKRLISLFGFVLKESGYLFLGSSETTGTTNKQFQTISKPWRIYKHTGKFTDQRMATPPAASNLRIRNTLGNINQSTHKISGADRLYRHLLEQCGPASILINEQNEILFALGDTSQFISLPSGEPSYDLFALVKPAIRSGLRTSLQRAQSDKLKVVTNVAYSTGHDRYSRVRISIEPVQAPEKQTLFLLTFDIESDVEDAPMATHDESWLVQQLEQELQATREDLQRTIEQLRIVNDDLRATNEESIAMNEELQSANEELESSKEELQSLNEELLASNAALDAKVEELEAANDDLNNLFSSTDIATIFLDTKYKIKRFTPATTRLMRLIDSDVGRPLTDIATNLIEHDLLKEAPQVMQLREAISSEVQDRNGNWYIKRMLPYRTSENRVIGLVITFTDVTNLKQAQQEIATQTSKLQEQAQLLDLAHVLARDINDKVVFWNRGAEALYGWTSEEALGRISHELLRTQFPKPLSEITAIVKSTGSWHGDLVHFTRDGRPVVVASNWVLYTDALGSPRAIVEVNNDITERKTYETELLETHRTLAHLAHHDPLTQLPNRMLLQDRLEHAIEYAKQSRRKVALLFLDLDRFKNVNDTLGHHIGDRILVQVTERLQGCLQPNQTLARFGGDEFSILLEGLNDITLASHVAGQIIEVLQPPFYVDDQEFYIGGSIGVSVYPDDAQGPEGLIRAADAAMYLAKEHGRGNYQFYTPNIDQRAHRQLAIENRLRRALDKNQLILHYQPQVDINSGQIVGAEALVRWHDPELGNVPPAEFIPIAEDTGLIYQLGNWVAGEACRQFKEWKNNKLPLQRIAINISAAQFQNEGLEKMLANVFSKTGLKGDELELELTERILLGNAEDAIAILGNLRAIGVRLSIDDFGTGYSSLHYLQHLHLTHIKVAREFVPAIVDDEDEMTIAKAIVSLANGLGLECTVEGIETEAQLEVFRNMGCHYMQGYLYSPPLPAADFEKLVRNPPKLENL